MGFLPLMRTSKNLLTKQHLVSKGKMFLWMMVQETFLPLTRTSKNLLTKQHLVSRGKMFLWMMVQETFLPLMRTSKKPAHEAAPGLEGEDISIDENGPPSVEMGQKKPVENSYKQPKKP